MRNTAIENGIIQLHGEIDAGNIRHYAASHNGNQSDGIEPLMFITGMNENIQPVDVGTFALPIPIKERRILQTIEQTGYMHPERICYTLNHADMNVMQIEENRIFVAEIVKPKTKKVRRKKCAKRKNREDAWKWEDLRFQPEIEPKYDCNVKPQNYAQFLNNPIRDPMFCQFDLNNNNNNKLKYNIDAWCEYDEYE